MHAGAVHETGVNVGNLLVHAAAELPVPDLAALLHRHRISAVPITDQHGTVIGLVSEYDLLSRTGQTARDVMSPGIISVSEDTDVEEVRFLLIERRIRRVPVMRGQQLVGIVSRRDLLNHALRTHEVLTEPLVELVPALANVS